MTGNPSDETIRNLLARARTIAVVGLSDRADRPSHEVASYLQEAGYRILPVNPNLAGSEVLGERVAASLRDVEGPVDVVDVFRRSEVAGEAVDEALVLEAPLIWLQLGVRDDAAAERARARGRVVVQDRCIKVEHARLCG